MVARIKSSVRRRRHVLQRHMDGDRHHFERGARQHHHRMQRPSLRRGEGGEILGMPGKGEARAIKHGLGDGVGDDGARRALPHEAHGALDRLRDRGRGGLVGPSGDDRAARPRIGSTGRARGEAAVGSVRLRRSSPIGTAKAERLGALGRARPGRRAGRKAESPPASAPTRRASVMSGPIPAGSPRVSARGRSARSMALRLARNAASSDIR